MTAQANDLDLPSQHVDAVVVGAGFSGPYQFTFDEDRLAEWSFSVGSHRSPRSSPT